MKLWVFAKLENDDLQYLQNNKSLENIIQRLGVYYYTYSNTSSWIPRDPKLWNYNYRYRRVSSIRSSLPELVCFRQLTDDDFGLTPVPTSPPDDVPPPDYPVTPVPTPVPTRVVPMRNRIIHEDGRPLMSEDSSYFVLG